jgi:HSP20 family protein
MAIFRKDGNQNQGTRRQDTSLVRGGEQGQMMRDPLDQMLMRDPFQMMREMMTNPFRAFPMMPWSDVSREMREWNPTFEVRETDDAFLFKGDMPGVRQEDLDISVAGNNLQLAGKRDREQESDEGTIHTYERAYGQFSRSFALPDSADVDKIKCDLKDGVLTLVVPKKAGSAQQRRKIQIGSGSKS